ncbi:unnamed protein product [Amoebophrya sp. A120]|nr:unnamed protein product [Amoebophrya sp. A120]|eukprot:GSA120T00012905001.1
MSRRRGRGFVREDLEVLGFLRDRKEAIKNGIRSEEQFELFSIDEDGKRFRILVPEARSYIRRLEREREEKLRALGAAEDLEQEKQLVRAIEYFDMQWRRDLLLGYKDVHNGRDEALRRVAGWSHRGQWKGVAAVVALRQAAGGFMTRRTERQDDDEAADMEDRTHLSAVTVKELNLIVNFEFLSKAGGNAFDSEHNRALAASSLMDSYYSIGGNKDSLGLPEGVSLSELQERALNAGVAPVTSSVELFGKSKVTGSNLSEWATLSRAMKKPEEVEESSSGSESESGASSGTPKKSKRISFADVENHQRAETLEDQIERELRASQAEFGHLTDQPADAEGNIDAANTGATTGEKGPGKEKDPNKKKKSKKDKDNKQAENPQDGGEEQPKMKELPDPTLMEPPLDRADYVCGIFEDPLGVLTQEKITRWQRVSLAAGQQSSFLKYQDLWSRLQSLFNSFQLNLVADFFICNYISQLDQLQRHGATEDAEKLSYAWMDLSTLSSWIPLYLRMLYPKADLLSPLQCFKTDMFQDVLRIVFSETPSAVRSCIRRVPYEVACVVLEVSRLYWLQYAENCGFDAAETGELSEIFNSFDMDEMESGGLRAERIFDVLEKAGFVLLPEERALLAMLYRQCDQDANGFIDFKELLYILRRFQDKRLTTQMVQCNTHVKHLPPVFVEEWQYLLEMDAEPKATDHDIVQMYNLFDLRTICSSFDFENLRKVVQRLELSRLELQLPSDFDREQACRLMARVYDEHDDLLLEWAKYLASKPPPVIEKGLEDVPIPQEIRPTTMKEHVDMWSDRHIMMDETKFRKYLASSAWVHDARKIIGAMMKSIRKRNWLAARMKGKEIQRTMEREARESEKANYTKKGTALMKKASMAAKMMGKMKKK